jgi:hypothetical protein
MNSELAAKKHDLVTGTGGRAGRGGGGILACRSTTIDLLGLAFLEAVNTGNPIAIHSDGTVVIVDY